MTTRQVIVAMGVTNKAPDNGNLAPMMQRVHQNPRAHTKPQPRGEDETTPRRPTEPSPLQTTKRRR